MPAANEVATPPKSGLKTLIIAACLITAGIGLAIHYYPVGQGISAALPWSHHISVHSPHGRSDLVMAMQSLVVDGAQLRMRPGRYQVKSSGHNIDVSLETDLTIDINKLVLSIPQPTPAPTDNAKAAPPNSRIRVDVQTADFKTTGGLVVAVDQFPAVRLNDVKVNAAATEAASVSAEVLFAKLIASMVTDVVDTPMETAEPVQRDFCPEYVSVNSAILSLRPGASIRLPVGKEMVLGDASQIHIRDLHYDASQNQSWNAKIDVNVSFAPPTEFASKKFSIQPGASRLAMSVDVTLDKDQLVATMISSPATPAKLTLAGGTIKQQAPVWNAELRDAEMTFDSFQYTASPRGQHANFVCDASLTANSLIHWERDGWRASATMLLHKMQFLVVPATPGTKTPTQFVAAPDQQTTLQGLVLEHNLAGGVMQLNLDELTMSGSLNTALSLNAAMAKFQGSGGQFYYTGRDGTRVSANFAAGGSFVSNPAPGQGAMPAVDLEIKGRATAVDISTKKNDKLHLQNLDLDLKSLLGRSPAISLACSGEIAVLTDKLAFAGARATITSLELQQGDQGKLFGHVALALSMPKGELINAAQAELAKPITIHGSHLGKVLEADVSVSDLQVDTRALKVGFNGPKLHVEGPLSVTGQLLMKRHIVVDLPVTGRIEKHTSNHDDFTLHARLSANASAAFPAAPDLANQTMELHFDYDKANLELGGFLGKLPLANDAFKEMLKAFGIERKIKSALPSKVTVHLFKSANGGTASALTRIRNPRLALTDQGDQLALSGTADIEY